MIWSFLKAILFFILFIFVATFLGIVPATAVGFAYLGYFRLSLGFFILVVLILLVPVATEPVILIDWYEEVVANQSTAGAICDVPYIGRTIYAIEPTVDLDDFEQCPSSVIHLRDAEDTTIWNQVRGMAAAGLIWVDGLCASFAQTPKAHEASVKTRACVKPPNMVDDSDHVPRCPCNHCVAWKTYERIQDQCILAESVTPVPFPLWNGRFPKGKAKTNRTVMEELEREGAYRRDFFYEMFVKKEPSVTYNDEDEAKEERPRAISAVSKKWKVLTGPFFKALSDWLAAFWNPYFYIWYVSGATSDDISAWFNRHLSVMQCPVYYYLDYSKYDSCQKERALKAEVRLFERFGAYFIPYWDFIVAAKINTVAYSKWVYYKVKGTRGSGESETSVGNSFLNGSIFNMAIERYARWVLEYVLKGMTITDEMVQIYADVVKKHIAAILMGDDFLAILDAHFIWVKLFAHAMRTVTFDLGFTIIDGLETKSMFCDFLSMLVIPTESGIKMGKKPGRNIARSGMLVDKGHNFSDPELAAIMYSNLNSAIPTSAHVPFLRVYVRLVMSHIKKTYPDLRVPKNYSKWERTQWKGTEGEADHLTWEAFEEKYGLSLADEMNFERYLRVSLERHGLFAILKHYSVTKMLSVEN
jgi:hypothetical protein